MSTDCLGIILSSATLIVSSLGILFGWKWHKDSKRQNLEQELAGVERDLANIEVEIEREKSAGHEQMSHIYGMVHPQANPHIAEINALIEKRDVLLKRKQEIKKQLRTK